MSLGRNANAGMNNYRLKTLFLFLVLGLAACKAPRPAAPVPSPFPPLPPGMVRPQGIMEVMVTNELKVLSFKWDTNNYAKPDLKGYYLYHGDAPHIYTNKVLVPGYTNRTSYTVQQGTLNYFGLTAISSNGIESGFATELVYPQYDAPAGSNYAVIQETETSTNLLSWELVPSLTTSNYFTASTTNRFFRTKLRTIRLP